MASHTDKIPLNDPFLKRNTRLLPCQKEMVLYWYYRQRETIRGIAIRFKVSRRTIQFIVFPDRLEKSLEGRRKRGGSRRYYNTWYNTQKHNEHLEHKNRILHLVDAIV
jgi:hypothetical protein